MDAKTIILDLKASGLNSSQIAKMAGITDAAVHYILSGKSKSVHRKTLFNLLWVHAAAVRKAQKRLEALQDAKVRAEVELASLRLQFEPLG